MSHAIDRHYSLRITPVRPEDWDVFLDWCTAESWIISEPERYLLQNQWHACFKILWEQEHRRAFISVVRYPSSAWIGNLIVDPLRRGCGYGSRLFNAELDLLKSADIQRIWLTASAMGEPLYRKHGFIGIETCERWIGAGTGACPGNPVPAQARGLQRIITRDAAAWGESRQELLEYLGSISSVVVNPQFATLVQPGIHSWHIGPWIGKSSCGDGAADITAAGDFIAQIRKTAPGGKALSADVLKSSQLAPYLEQAGFCKTGTSALMCRTSRHVDLDRVYALASLGSIG
ncbi:MAG: GNAT family N-acetyltransferase [Thermodesulfobacteriota bacterium]